MLYVASGYGLWGGKPGNVLLAFALGSATEALWRTVAAGSTRRLSQSSTIESRWPMAGISVPELNLGDGLSMLGGRGAARRAGPQH
jgi:hypothetical protein